MGGGGGGDSETTVRYAPYLEKAHKQLINHDGSDEPSLSLIDVFNATLNTSPYGGNSVETVDGSMFGAGYDITSFPCLWDMFGRFMGALDICDLWGFMYENVLHSPEIEAAVTAHSAVLAHDIESNTLPRFNAGMRDINSVMASSFIIGRSLIEQERVRDVNKFQADIRIRALAEATSMWKSHLDWNKSVVTVFNDMNKQYYMTTLDVNDANLGYLAKHAMWNLNLFENLRGFLGALGGGSATSSMNEPSKTQKVLGGAMAGASLGMMTGNPLLAGVGAVVGGLASIF